MAADAPPAIGAAAAQAVLAAANAGYAQAPDIPGAVPLLVVDMDDGDMAAGMPPGFACIVIGVATRPPSARAPAGVDIAVAPGPAGSGPPGWVAVDDPAAEADRLARRIADAPRAALVLAQVLRAGVSLSPEADGDGDGGGGARAGAGLLVESLAYATLQGGPTHAAWLARRPGAGAGSARPGQAAAVRVERAGDVLAVTLDRPEVHNAFNVAMRDDLCDALAVACADPAVRVELRGAGRSFCSGGDLTEFGARPDPASAHLVRTTRSPAQLLHALAARTTAYLHGACIGAGIELAAVAGEVVGSPDIAVSLPEVAMGLIPGAGGTVSIPARIGRHRTAWLGVGGTAIDIEVASRWGLVDRVGMTTSDRAHL